MIAITSNDGRNFTASLDVYGIILPSQSQYKLTFRSFIHCASTGCEDANDYILIQTREGIGLHPLKSVIKIDYSKGRIKDDKSVLDEVIFNVNTVTNFYVNRFSYTLSNKC